MPEAATRSPKPKRGETLDLKVDGLAQGGRGVARHDGYVVFVAGALPGDRVRARIDRSRRAFGEATVVELLDPSPERIPEVCTHGGETCPGAPWQALPYERQLAEKQRLLDEALRRLGRLDDFEVEPIVAAVERWGYRNKLEYSFGEADGELALGFHRRGSWSEIVDAAGCRLASERADAARANVVEWASRHGVEPYDPRTGSGALRNLVVRDGRRTGQVQTRLVTAPVEIPRPPTDLHTIVEGPGSGTDGPTGATGEEYLRERLGGIEVEVSATAFLQTNTEMADLLYATVGEFAALSGRERVFDLYCGVGTIGLALAGRAGEVWGVESVPEAVADAERNAERNEIENARFRTADARLGIRPLIEEAGRPDLVVVDPPRAGLSKKIVRRVIECEARRIVYVSCNPTTLAPNAAQLTEAGYRLRRVRPVDMFPQTPHIECVAELERA